MSFRSVRGGKLGNKPSFLSSSFSLSFSLSVSHFDICSDMQNLLPCQALKSCDDAHAGRSPNSLSKMLDGGTTFMLVFFFFFFSSSSSRKNTISGIAPLIAAFRISSSYLTNFFLEFIEFFKKHLNIKYWFVKTLYMGLYLNIFLLGLESIWSRRRMYARRLNWCRIFFQK